MRLTIFIYFIFVHFVKSDNTFNFFKDDIDRSQYFDSKYTNSKPKQQFLDNFNKYLLLITYEDRRVNDDNFKPIARFHDKSKSKMTENDITMNQHKARMKEIINFMEDHLLTTIYLYDEVQRIKRNDEIKDELREMVSYLEKPQNEFEKEAVLKCFYNSKKKKTKKTKSIWDQKTNDLVINVLKDPYNDGTIN